MERENIKKELEDISPGLTRIVKENPFNVPANYFDTLPQQIQNRIAAKENKAALSSVFFRRPQFIVSAITALLLIFAGYFFLVNNSGDAQFTLSDQAWFDDHIAYYADYQPGVYYDMVFSEYDTADDMVLEDISEEQILEYLIDYENYFMEYTTLENNIDNQQ